MTTSVLLAQLAPVPGDVDANLATAVELLDAHPGVDLVVLPELFLQGYTLPGIAARALPVDGERLAPLRSAARRRGTAVVLGLAEHLPGRLPANSALCLDASGEVAGVYRKVHLFGSEREHFSSGEEYTVVPLAGLRVGPMICYDVEFPEPARALALAGADLLVTVSANMTPYEREHDLFARARALENRRPHVYVNRVGTESGLRFVGRSCVVDAVGEVTAALGPAPQVRTVVGASGARPRPDYLADRRPGVPAVAAGRRRPAATRSGGPS